MDIRFTGKNQLSRKRNKPKGIL